MTSATESETRVPAPPLLPPALDRLKDSTIGLKAVMAVTGLLLFGFALAHLVGNLQFFAGAEKINAYAKFLHANPALVWGARFVLLMAVFAHAAAALKLTLVQWRARPVAYAEKRSVAATFGSRTMIFTGPLLALYVVYHILHFTTGQAHPSFDFHDVYRNMVVGFQNVPASCAYIVAMLALGFHLSHGLWSLCQTIGLNGRAWDRCLRVGSAAVAALITLGFIAIPVSVLAGVMK